MPKFKLYTHNFNVLKIRVKKTNPLFLLFYYVGLSVITIFTFIYKSFRRVFTPIFGALETELQRTKTSALKRLQIIQNRNFVKTLAIFLVIAGFGFCLIASAKLIARALETKNSVLASSSQGTKFLNQAKDALKNQDLEKANYGFLMAYKSFQNGQKQLSEAGNELAHATDLLPETKDAASILKIASLISETGQQFIALYKNSSSLKLTAMGLNGSSPQIWEDLNGSVEKINSNLNQAANLANTVNEKSLPKTFGAQFGQAKVSLLQTQTAFANFEKIFKILYFLHSGKRNILVVFENNNELRATGGFMGTFGSLKLNNGELESVHISSIYDLDGQLQENITPPTPILNVNPRWYLRDSNWFADFPQSARIITEFYEKEGGETPDAVIALTPDLIIDLLKITGPITLDKYNLTLNADNFFEHIQVASSVSYINITPGQPKQVLADFMPVLLQKLGLLKTQDWPLVLEAIQKNFNQKNILIYSHIPEIENISEEFNWSGHIINSDRDYLQISTSNLGGTKTDLYINSAAGLKTNIEEDGSITQELTITRTNTMPKQSNTQNMSYIRILVPLGSQLISNTGFDFINLDNQKNPDFKTDPDVYQWEKNSVRDVLSGTVIGQEAGKTFFGNWLKLEGGETKTVKLLYKPPFKLSSIDHYGLVLQKQAGALPFPIKWDLSFKTWSLDWQNFNPENLETNSASANIVLDKDQLFGLVINKR